MICICLGGHHISMFFKTVYIFSLFVFWIVGGGRWWGNIITVIHILILELFANDREYQLNQSINICKISQPPHKVPRLDCMPYLY